MKRLIFSVIAMLAAICYAGEAATQAPVPNSAVRLADLTKVLEVSRVDVIYHLKYDARGDAPAAVGLFCSACDMFHDRDLRSVLTDRRDLTVTGYAVAECTVLTGDLLIDDKGIAAIEVRHGQDAVPAKIAGIYPVEGGLRLELEKPLADVQPLAFDENAKAPFFAYSRIKEGGEWMERLTPYPCGVEVFQPEMARRSISQPGNSLIVTADGKVAALFLNNNETQTPEGWRTPWTKWEEVSPEVMAKNLAAVNAHILAATAPVTIQFAPSKLSRRERLNGRVEREELDGVAMMLPDGRIFSPFLLTPEQHSRIEKVLVHLSGGVREAKVAGVMRNFGGIVLVMADGKESGLKPIAPECGSIAGAMGNMVAAARLHTWGRKVGVLTDWDILGGTMKGFGGHRWGATLKQYPGDLANVVFSHDGKLIAFDVALRLFNYERKMILFDAAELEKLLLDPAETVPLAELSNPVNAVALLGVEYQSLSAEVAQSEEIAHLTRNGQEGLMVSYVYPGSPAATLGLKPGDVLLKLILPEGGAPLVLTGEKFANDKEQQFPWDKLDAIPEMYFGEIPEPWPGVKDRLNMLLTRIGIGQKVRLIVIQNHALKTLDWTIAASPVYYDIAPEYTSAALGIAVRDVTFELRRFFRMKEDAPGVIIADVTAGSAASTAGLRPFELITAVNDTPVHNVKELEKAIAGKTEVRLAVKRLAASRVVTVALPAGPRR